MDASLKGTSSAVTTISKGILFERFFSSMAGSPNASFCSSTFSNTILAALLTSAITETINLGFSFNADIQVSGIIVKNSFVEPHGITDHCRCQLRYQFLLGIFRVSEFVTTQPVQTFSRTCRMSHFMKCGGIEFHAVLIDFFIRLAFVELCLHRKNYFIT